MSDCHREATSSHGRVRSELAAAFSRRRNSGWTRVATRSTTAGGSLVLAASGRRSGRSRVYMKPSTKRAWTESAGTPSSAKARPNPAVHGLLHEPLADRRGAAGEVGPVEGPTARSGWGELVVLHQRALRPGRPPRITGGRRARARRIGAGGARRRAAPGGRRRVRLRRPGRAARRARPDRFPPVLAPGRAGEGAGGAPRTMALSPTSVASAASATTTSVTVSHPAGVDRLMTRESRPVMLAASASAAAVRQAAASGDDGRAGQQERGEQVRPAGHRHDQQQCRRGGCGQWSGRQQEAADEAPRAGLGRGLSRRVPVLEQPDLAPALVPGAQAAGGGVEPWACASRVRGSMDHAERGHRAGADRPDQEPDHGRHLRGMPHGYARAPVWYRSHPSQHLRCCDRAETPPAPRPRLRQHRLTSTDSTSIRREPRARAAPNAPPTATRSHTSPRRRAGDHDPNRALPWRRPPPGTRWPWR